MFRYRRNSKGMFDNLDDPGGFLIREQDLEIMRKDNIPFEVVDDSRKAGDIFNGVEEADLENDLELAYEFLTEPMKSKPSKLDDHIASLDIKLKAFKAIDDALVEAGVNPGEFTKKIRVGKGKNKRNETIRTLKRLDTGDLQGGAPGPYVKNTPTHEIRVHVKRRNDGELVPAGVEPTVLGMAPHLTKDEQATEVIQRKALQLAGMNASPGNTRVDPVTGRTMHHYSDHLVELPDGKQIRVEGKIRSADGRFKNTDNVPSHTFIVPIGGENLPLPKMRRLVDTMITDHMKDYNTDVITATEALLADGKLGIDDDQSRLGKLLRSDPAYMNDPEGIYDQMIVTGYPGQTILHDDDFKSKKLVKGPSSIHLVPNLKALKDSVVDSNSRRILVTKNEGHSGHGRPRTQVQTVVPIQGKRDGKPLYIDMRKSFSNDRAVA